MQKTTSWGSVAGWYDDLLEKQVGTYQADLILPNLLRLLEPKRGETILDLACGQGFFARAIAEAASGVKVIGVDLAPELIAIAKKRSAEHSSHKVSQKTSPIEYHASSADRLPFIQNASVDKALIVLAIQNIEDMLSVFKEAARVVKKSGTLVIVLNHPCFRIPKASSWGYDKDAQIQYRRVDGYISESKTKIQMHPGAKPDDYTLTFHRPLQSYAKALGKAGFVIAKIEEWNSKKKSERGPREATENRARKEIPLFLMIEAMRFV